MAELTWRGTFMGAFVLLLIGIVCASSLLYARASMTSIKVGLEGPLDCKFDSTKNTSIIIRPIECNETTFLKVQRCVYLFVSYTPDGGNETIHGIKLSPHYRYEHPPKRSHYRQYIDSDGQERALGECSADYCGNYRFKFPNGTYKYVPDIINKTRIAERDNSGTFKCFLNPNKPQNGAYLYLNNPDGLKQPEQRMFRTYEAWAMLVTPSVIGVGIIIYLCVIFLQIQLESDDTKTTKHDFVPPGFAESAEESIHEESNVDNISNRADNSDHKLV